MAYYSDSSSDGEAAINELLEDPEVLKYMSGLPSNSLADDAPDGDELPEEPKDSRIMTARAYQQEMLDASLKQNIIVAVLNP